MLIIWGQGKKRPPARGGLSDLKGHVGHLPDPQHPCLHEVLNSNSSVVAVGVNTESSKSLVESFGKWVRNDSVTSLKADFWLE